MNLNAFVGNTPVNTTDLLGLRQIRLRIYFDDSKGTAKITAEVKAEFERILANALKKCRPCDGSDRHEMTVGWLPSDDKRAVRGFDANNPGCSGPLVYSHYCFNGAKNFNPNSSPIAITFDGSSSTGLVNTELERFLKRTGSKVDLSVAAALAHEVALHGIAELGRNFHFNDRGFIDSAGLHPEAVGGELSDSAVEALCKALNR